MAAGDFDPPRRPAEYNRLRLEIVIRRGERMNPILQEIIARFRAAQDRGVAAVVGVLGPTLGVRLPASNREWVAICSESGLYHVRRVNGLEVYAHGYGLEIAFPDVTIDFDWGDEGEPDGFDAWRLWNFVRENQPDVPCESHLQMIAWLEEAHEGRKLTRDRHLYYSPAHRAPKQPPPGE
jgi:hypothetical protein